MIRLLLRSGSAKHISNRAARVTKVARWPGDSHRAVCGLALVCGAASRPPSRSAPAAAAGADTASSWPPPPELRAWLPTLRSSARRARGCRLAVGMGSTFDSVGLPDGTHAVPAFFATGGVGDGLVGLDFGVFASSAVGRYGGRQSGRPAGAERLRRGAAGGPAAPRRSVATGCGSCARAAPGAGSGPRARRAHRPSPATGSSSTSGRASSCRSPRVGAASQLRLRLAAGRNLGLYTPRLSGKHGGRRDRGRRHRRRALRRARGGVLTQSPGRFKAGRRRVDGPHHGRRRPSCVLRWHCHRGRFGVRFDGRGRPEARDAGPLRDGASSPCPPPSTGAGRPISGACSAARATGCWS